MNATFEPPSPPADTGPTCVGACGTPPATTATPTAAPTKTPPEKVTCRKGKRLAHGRCVKRKHRKHKKKAHRK
jgi:hypothetical protein